MQTTRKKPITAIRRAQARLEKNAHFKKLENELQTISHKEQVWLHKLKKRHKFIFALLVFFGVILLWAGAWQLISLIPYLNQPVVSVIAGVVILLALGYFYENVL